MVFLEIGSTFTLTMCLHHVQLYEHAHRMILQRKFGAVCKQTTKVKKISHSHEYSQ